MRNYLPVLIVGAIIGTFTTVFLIAYLGIRKQKEAIGFDRYMSDGEIIRRLAGYVKPYWKNFVLVLCIMLLSISYDLLSPMIVGRIEEMIKLDFEMSELLKGVMVYAGVLIVSVIGTYFQSIILQKTGQRILSTVRQDVFEHIEKLSHEQLNQIPVGKLVTRVTNDTNALSMTFTNVLVQMVKNAFVIAGVLVAMLLLRICGYLVVDPIPFEIIYFVLSIIISVNISLMVFNLLPIPPLDGSRLWSTLLPGRWAFFIEQNSRYFTMGLFILLAVGALDLPLAFLNNAVYWLLDFITGLPFG